jgi:hypothetical protein
LAANPQVGLAWFVNRYPGRVVEMAKPSARVPKDVIGSGSGRRRSHLLPLLRRIAASSLSPSAARTSCRQRISATSRSSSERGLARGTFPITGPGDARAASQSVPSARPRYRDARR